MRKILLCVIMVLAVSSSAFADVPIDAAHFPDALFRSYVKQAFDTDKNDMLKESELGASQIVPAQKLGYDEATKITSLSGIEYFTKCGVLLLAGAQLTELDISKNPKLWSVNCNSNSKLSKVTLNESVTELSLDDCSLTQLDTSKSSQLRGLYIANNKISRLDLSNNPNINTLSCSNNNMTELILPSDAKFVNFTCDGNNLPALDLSSSALTLDGITFDYNMDSFTYPFQFDTAELKKRFNIAGAPSINDGEWVALMDSSRKSLAATNNLQYTGGNPVLLNNTLLTSGIPEDEIKKVRIISFAFVPKGKRISNPYQDYVRVWIYHNPNASVIVDPADLPQITTSVLPGGTTGTPYNQRITASGKAPITFTISGALPDGLSFSPYGVFSGTPTTAGKYTLEVTATNSEGSDTKSFTLNINEKVLYPPSITSSLTLPDATESSPYRFTFNASGLNPKTWSADNVPAGLTLANTGLLSGTPTEAGTFTFDVQASNADGKDKQTFTLKVSELVQSIPPTITTAAPPAAAKGAAYTYQLSASGTPPFVWTLKGKLPSGLTMSSSGLISGTPKKKGKSTITLTASNDFGTASRKVTLSVCDLPKITTTSLKDATIAKKYSASVKAKGTSPFVWSIKGTLPRGITFDAKNGKFVGTPTAIESCVVQVTVRNSVGEDTKSLTLNSVAILPSISPSKLSAWTWGKAKKTKLTVKGTAPITLSMSGTLPAGLTYNTVTQTIGGTPTETCTDRQITFTAKNIGGTTTKTYALTVKAAAPKITTKSLPGGVVGRSYGVQMEAEGTPAITWSATGLPDGLSITSSGKFSGTPTKAGKFTAKITATNSAKSVKKSYKITISEVSASSFTEGEVFANPAVPAEGGGDFAGELVIAAELPEISVDVEGMYDFSATLSPDVEAGEELVYLAGSSEPSEDDEIVEFYDEEGCEIDTVPENRKVSFSAWFRKGVVYKPAIAVKYSR